MCTDDPDFLEGLSSQGCTGQTDEHFPKRTIHFLVQGLIKNFKKPHSKILITSFTVKFQKTLRKMAVITEDPLKGAVPNG